MNTREVRKGKSEGYPSGSGSGDKGGILGFIEESKLSQRSHELREPTVPEGSTEDGVGILDSVETRINGGVPVGKALEVEAGVVHVDVLGEIEKPALGRGGKPAVAQGLGGVQAGGEHSPWGPAELVSEGVIGGLWRRESTADGSERQDLRCKVILFCFI